MTVDNEPQPVRITHAVRLREPIWTGVYLAIGFMLAFAGAAVVVGSVVLIVGALR